jgi:outer membrane protein assembly factor BamB
MIFFGGGDGFCYAFDPEPASDGTLREIWRYDGNAPHYRKSADGKPMKYGTPKGPSEIVATPVFHQGRVYVAIGQDPESGDGVGRMNCIDPAAGTGDITEKGRVWTYDKIGRSTSTAAVAPDGLLYVADFAGKVYCLESATGKEVWVHDVQSRVWGSTLVADGKVFVGNEDGMLLVLQAGRADKQLAEVECGGPVYSTPVAANGVLFVGTDQNLFAFKEGGAK